MNWLNRNDSVHHITLQRARRPPRRTAAGIMRDAVWRSPNVSSSELGFGNIFRILHDRERIFRVLDHDAPELRREGLVRLLADGPLADRRVEGQPEQRLGDSLSLSVLPAFLMPSASA